MTSTILSTSQGSIPDFPAFELHGGPYDGHRSARDDEPWKVRFAKSRIDSVLYFPESVIVKGDAGSAVYALVDHDEGDRYGKFERMG